MTNRKELLQIEDQNTKAFCEKSLWSINKAATYLGLTADSTFQILSRSVKKRGKRYFIPRIAIVDFLVKG